MGEIETKNAVIKRTALGYGGGDHQCLTAYIYLKYDGGGQGFGGYALDSVPAERDARFERRPHQACGHFVAAVLKVLEIDDWENLAGVPCRVRAEHSKVHAIGHYLKDKWFNPAEEFEAAYAKERPAAAKE